LAPTKATNRIYVSGIKAAVYLGTVIS